MKNEQENKKTELKEETQQVNIVNDETNYEYLREVYPANVEGTKEFKKINSSDDIWDNHQGDIVHW